MYSSHRKLIGSTGEDIAARFLKKKGFEILDRNYLEKWGKIDIVARRGSIIHFVEVKTVTREINDKFSRETDIYRPEDNVHPQKLKRMYRAIESYLGEKGIESEWCVDVVSITLDLERKRGRCRFLENVL